MHFSDLLVRRGRHIQSTILEEAYRSRAKRLRSEASEPCNRRRRALLFYAACEYDSLADRTAEAAQIKRATMTHTRALDRKRRVRGEARTHGGRAV